MTDEAWKETERINMRVEMEGGRRDRNKDIAGNVSDQLTHSVIGLWGQKRDLDF